MVKIISLFLVGMVVLAMFGRLRYPGQKTIANAKCPNCGRMRLRKSPCRCGGGNGA